MIAGQKLILEKFFFKISRFLKNDPYIFVRYHRKNLLRGGKGARGWKKSRKASSQRTLVHLVINIFHANLPKDLCGDWHDTTV